VKGRNTVRTKKLLLNEVETAESDFPPKLTSLLP
jgi:hypothetical protein